MAVGRWPEPCTCIPGSELEGWQEVRSPECQAHERKIWSDFFARMPDMLARMRQRRQKQIEDESKGVSDVAP